MKKKLFGAVLGMSLSAVMAMGAFAGEITAEEVLENYQAAASSVKEIVASVEGVADVTISMPDQDATLGVTGNINMDMAATLDPLSAEISGSMKGEAVGEGGAFDMHMYMVPAEDGGMSMYAGVDQGEGMEWMLTSLDSETMAQLQEMIANSSAMPQMPIQFELADSNVEIDGVECYPLVASLGWEDMMELFNFAMEQAGDAVPEGTLPDEETLAAVGSMLDGIVLNIEIDVDTESYLPVRAHFDFEGSDWVTLSAVLASVLGAVDEEGNLMPLNLEVGDLYLEYYYDNSTPVEIVVPDEVVESAQDVGDVTDLAGSAAEMVEEVESEF